MPVKNIRVIPAKHCNLTVINQCRQSIKVHFFVLIVSLLTACGGGGSGDGGGGTPPPADPFAIACATSSTDLHGCWSSTCELMDTSTMYGLYIVNFLSSGDYSTYFRLYENASCTGLPFSHGRLVNDAYVIGNDVMTINGTIATQLDIANAGLTGLSIYDITITEELCFPDSDYNWSSAGGGLGTAFFTETFRPDTIDYTTCMMRFTP